MTIKYNIRDITIDAEAKEIDVYYFARGFIKKDEQQTNGYAKKPTLEALKKYCNELNYSVKTISTEYCYIIATEHGDKFAHIVDIWEILRP